MPRVVHVVGRGGTESGRGGLFPALLRHWRRQRGLSQLDLALAADVSSRHLSFLETGRSSPSAEMVLRLAAALDVPLRHVNAMLRAADHPPRYPEAARGEQLPASVRSTLELMKQHHEPFPLVVMDRTYGVLDLNDGALAVLGAVMPSLTAADLAEVNLARLTLDPEVGGRVVVNHEAVRSELLWRMQRELLADPDDARLRILIDELIATSGLGGDWREPDPTSPTAPTLELQVRAGEETWSFRLVVSALQAPLEVVLDEIRIEQWFPADDLTAEACTRLASR
jgi:transcriptional regulator with XRE-family HTH domain